MTSRRATTILWRPTGPKELDLVRELDDFNAHIAGEIQVVHEFR
ncbi:hypothetical protein ACIBL6_14300 [Streptomyces sp. NPDC050400]